MNQSSFDINNCRVKTYFIILWWNFSKRVRKVFHAANYIIKNLFQGKLINCFIILDFLYLFNTKTYVEWMHSNPVLWFVDNNKIQLQYPSTSDRIFKKTQERLLVFNNYSPQDEIRVFFELENMFGVIATDKDAEEVYARSPELFDCSIPDTGRRESECSLCFIYHSSHNYHLIFSSFSRQWCTLIRHPCTRIG